MTVYANIKRPVFKSFNTIWSLLTEESLVALVFILSGGGVLWRTIPNQHILINAITINEIKDSSAIENIVTTHESIYKVLIECGFKEDAVKEVVDYRSAIWRGYEIIKEKGYISTNILVEL